MDPKEQSIGVFDSGFGGLTVMRAICKLMPNENIVYFGDTAHLPYGNKSQDTILRYSLENASLLIDRGVKALVIACNTSCSAALSQIRKAFSIPIIGITEQGVEETIALVPPRGKIAILGTRATIASGVYQQQIQAHRPHLAISAIPCPLFVPLVEEGYSDHPLSSLIAQEYLKPLKGQFVDAILLGCTHYPLLQSAIQKELDPTALLIDPAYACAQKTRKVLLENDLLNPSILCPRYEFFVSDDPEKFRLMGKAFLNYPIEHVCLGKKPETRLN